MKPVMARYQTEIEFPNCLLLKNQIFYDKQIQMLSNQVKLELHTQRDLPNNLKDNTIIETYRNKRAMYIEKR